MLCTCVCVQKCICIERFVPRVIFYLSRVNQSDQNTENSMIHPGLVSVFNMFLRCNIACVSLIYLLFSDTVLAHYSLQNRMIQVINHDQWKGSSLLQLVESQLSIFEQLQVRMVNIIMVGREPNADDYQLIYWLKVETLCSRMYLSVAVIFLFLHMIILSDLLMESCKTVEQNVCSQFALCSLVGKFLSATLCQQMLILENWDRLLCSCRYDLFAALWIIVCQLPLFNTH